ncbi:MAG: hypothetical protein WD598_01355 [Acidimicrobiia bacterium]
MRRVLLFFAVLVLMVGCSGSQTPKASKAFCLAADRYDSELERQQKRGEIDIDRQIERVAELARTAPKAVDDAAQVFLDALERVEDDPSIKDDPDVREAVDDVNRLANQACGVYDREGGL